MAQQTEIPTLDFEGLDLYVRTVRVTCKGCPECNVSSGDVCAIHAPTVVVALDEYLRKRNARLRRATRCTGDRRTVLTALVADAT